MNIFTNLLLKLAQAPTKPTNTLHGVNKFGSYVSF